MSKLTYVVAAPAFRENSGGVVALYSLAREIDLAGEKSFIYDLSNEKLYNPIYSNYAEPKIIDENTVVIYPEIIEGNPLKASKIVRWILCDLGVHCDKEIYKTWNPNDLIYHYSCYNPTETDRTYNILFTTYTHPKIKDKNHYRYGSCHVFRKATKFHKNIDTLHPPDSLCLDGEVSQDILIEVFQSKRIFFCYDPYSYMIFMAILCGCVTVIHPIQGVSRDEWYRSLFYSKALRESGHTFFAGIAYGMEYLEEALKTIRAAHEQHLLIIKFSKKTVHRFIEATKLYYYNNIIASKVLTVKDVYPDSADSLQKLNFVYQKLKLSEVQLWNDIKILLKKVARTCISKFDVYLKIQLLKAKRILRLDKAI